MIRVVEETIFRRYRCQGDYNDPAAQARWFFDAFGVPLTMVQRYWFDYDKRAMVVEYAYSDTKEGDLS